MKIDNDSDSQTVEEMVEKGVIKRNNDGTYTILDKERLQKDYFTKIENESTVPNQSVNIDFDAEVTTDSVEKAVTPKSGNLHKDKTARNEFRKDVTDFIKNEYLTNPDKEEEIRTFVAENKYSKQIAKKTTKLNGELKTPRQVLQHYHEKYANADEKKAIGDVVKAVQNLDVDFLETFSGNVDNKKLLKAYNKVTGENLDRLPNDKLDDAKKYFAITALIDTVNSKQTHEGNKYKIQDFINDPNIRKEVAYEFLCAQDGFNKDGIINRIATLEVMGTKLSEKDKEYYTKHQSKLMLEKEIEEQNKDNFVVCYSKKQSKALEKNNIDPNN